MMTASQHKQRSAARIARIAAQSAFRIEQAKRRGPWPVAFQAALMRVAYRQAKADALKADGTPARPHISSDLWQRGARHIHARTANSGA